MLYRNGILQNGGVPFLYLLLKNALPLSLSAPAVPKEYRKVDEKERYLYLPNRCLFVIMMV